MVWKIAFFDRAETFSFQVRVSHHLVWKVLMEFVLLFIVLGVFYVSFVDEFVGTEILFEWFLSIDSGVLVDLRMEGELIFVQGLSRGMMGLLFMLVKKIVFLANTKPKFKYLNVC